MNIVFPSFIDLTEEAKAECDRLGVKTFDDLPTNETEVVERIKDAEVIAAKHVNITASIIDGAPNLKYIISPAVGYQAIDCEHALAKGITVLNCPAYNAIAVAEHAIELLLAVNRKLIGSVESLRSGEWQPSKFRGTELFDKQLGIIGYGNIGKHVGVIAKGFGMNVFHVNSISSQQDLDNLITNSDVVCLTLPLNDSTHHLIDERRLKLMSSHSFLINVGRGETVDQEALQSALKDNRIAGAGLDVFENEPRHGDAAIEIIALAKLPNVVATPHLAYNTVETKVRMSKVLMQNIHDCIAGKPINIVAQP